MAMNLDQPASDRYPLPTVSLHLPDDSFLSLPGGSTFRDAVTTVGPEFADRTVAVVVNGVPGDLSARVRDGDSVHWVTVDSEAGREVLRHSTAHVLAQAVVGLFPGAQFSVGPAVEDGFFYDFELPGGRTLSDVDLAAIEEEMRRIVGEDQPFTRSEVSAGEARALFADQRYKLEIIDRVVSGTAGRDDTQEAAPGGALSVYRNSEHFVDLCRGPHVPSTGRLGWFSLQKVAGAHWRGNEQGPMLQRVYGTAWESQSALDEHLHRLEEAAKRDHRRLANELDLLSFPPELGGGLAVWHPNGAVIRKLMEDYSRRRHEEGGYQFVYTPHLANAGLFETSGHLGFYRDGMYPPMELDNGTYYMKPMNCPMHCLIFAGRQRSYRELPLRLFELGNVYRYERAGTLHGLMRIRGFTQDDSHIFATEEQLGEEIASLLGFVMSVLRRFGFTEFTANLSTKDPEKFVGTDEMWDRATEALTAALDGFGLEYGIKEGDAAFYGPKIDIDVRDAIGRRWQLSTIQLDFNQPERFGLEYVARDGSRRRPVMLHRALFGSIERFFGVLLEHYAGAFPLWLAPVQVRVLPVASAHAGYADSVAGSLRTAGFRVDVVAAEEPLGKRIRNAKLKKIPYVIVVGDEDAVGGTVGVNTRDGGVERGVLLTDLMAAMVAELS
jgi:threonyl-tRNA synthetase